MLFRYYCAEGTVGQYIYVGKFTGNTDYLHITHVSANSPAQGNELWFHFPSVLADKIRFVLDDASMHGKIKEIDIHKEGKFYNKIWTCIQ